MRESFCWDQLGRISHLSTGLIQNVLKNYRKCELLVVIRKSKCEMYVYVYVLLKSFKLKCIVILVLVRKQNYLVAIILFSYVCNHLSHSLILKVSFCVVYLQFCRNLFREIATTNVCLCQFYNVI